MGQKVIIIAEAGVNHNGSIKKAMELIDAAAIAGVDYIKFQTFKTELSISRKANKAAYQLNNITEDSQTQYEMLKNLELSFEDFRYLKEYCTSKNIKFLSTGFDISSIDFLDKIGIDFFKIPSGEITNKPYLQHIAKKKRPVILSTGMANLAEIEEALGVMMHKGLKKEQLTILHCNTEYPTPMQDVNLKAMLTIRDAFKVKVGYSDHTLGIEIPIAAASLGATVIEKHFTLDKNLPGPDHKASLEPHELLAMTKAIRNIELATSGEGIKQASPSEYPNKAIARKSIHIKYEIPKGTKLTEDNIVMKRPGDGISPMKISETLGRFTTRKLPKDYKLSWSDLV